MLHNIANKTPSDELFNKTTEAYLFLAYVLFV